MRDVARANVLVMERDKANFEAFNVGSQRGTTVLEMARLIAQACDKTIPPVLPGEFRFGDTRHTVSDSSKLWALGWEPTVPVEQIVAEYVAWIRKQPEVRDYYAETERQMKQAGVVRSVANGLDG